MAERVGQWHTPADKLPPVLTEVPIWINGRHMVGYYNGIAWFGRRGILPKPPMLWFESAASPQPQKHGTAYAESFGYSLAMRVLQSDLYHSLDERERAECDELIQRGQEPQKHGTEGGE